jgi:hypothetical protein
VVQDNFSFYDWERGALQELYREYRSIFRNKALPLRPAAIALFDSETHWGCWEPLTRTISLSRQLVQNHPWFQVLGILRHEMAHQWADEAPGHAPGNLPHGERFKLGCRIIGVPQEFSKATANLKESPLDWREEKRDERSEKLLDKVRKLLALATSSNEHEALLAMSKVREFYAKYNLEQAAEDARSSFAHIVITHGKKRIEAHQDKITGILVGHFFVQVLTFSQFDAKSGERNRAMEIIGTRENAVMAEYVYHFLLYQTEFWVKEATKGKDAKISRLQRKSYRLGILDGFAEKLAKADSVSGAEEKDSSDEYEKTEECVGTELSLIGTAMARFRRDTRLKEYLSDVYPRLGTRGYSWQGIDQSAFIAGRAVGKTITLSKAITTEHGNRGRLLASGV